MLDSEKELRAIDQRDMLTTIGLLPDQLTEGIGRGKRSGSSLSSPREVVVCGVGGSAIGGNLLREWLTATTELGCEVQREYSVPKHIGKDSLVIVASYSGNTEETISMFEDARRKRAKIVAITSGGKLAQICDSLSVPIVNIPEGLLPRASLGYMFGAMLGLMEKAVGSNLQKQGEETVRVLEKVSSKCRLDVKTHDNPAKMLAHEIFHCVPVVIGYGLSTPVARRWANQLNENGKSMAFFSEIPELDHNVTVGWMKDPRSKGFAAVFLDHEGVDEAMKRRVAATKEMFGRVSSVCSANAVGLSPLARMMSLLMIGDYTSAYLGILRREDPSTNEAIDELKSILSKK